MIDNLSTIYKPLTYLVTVVLLSFGLMSCATTSGPSPATAQGVAVGTAVGTIAGSLIDRDNGWRGAAIGGLLGGVLGGALTEISQQAAYEAAAEGRPVAYRSRDGYERIEAAPLGYDESTRCHKIRERVWRDGTLVKDEVKEVCESERVDPVY